MGNTAADIAQGLSQHKAKDVQKEETPVDVAGGGIEVETPDPTPPEYVTGTPFDLVKGRPQVDFWGPLETYGFVTTPYGEYAIEPGKILRLTHREEFDTKEGRMVMRTFPVYEDAPQALLDYIA